MMTSLTFAPLELDAQGNAILNKPPGFFGFPCLSDDEAYSARRCAHCSVGDCKLWCRGCDVTGVGKIRTFYCGESCQKKDWEKHKPQCSSRRSIARIASITYELYIAFEKATSVKPTEKVSEKNGVLTIARMAADSRAFTGAPLFLQFPGKVLPSGAPASLANSVLLDQACGEVFTTARPLLALLIEPYCAIYEAVSIQAKKPVRVIFAYSLPKKQSATAEKHDHSVVKITTANGTSYALDLTAAQFGWDEILYDWETFLKHRALNGVEGSSRIEENSMDEQFLKMMFCGEPPNSFNAAQHHLRYRVMDHFIKNLKSLLTDSFASLDGGALPSLKHLVAKKPDAFLAGKDKFLKRAVLYPQEVVESLLSQGIGRVFLGEDGLAQVTMSTEDAARYEGVWFEEGDKRLVTKSEKKLKDTWQKRLKRSLDA